MSRFVIFIENPFFDNEIEEAAMRNTILTAIIVLLLGAIPCLAYQSLQELFNQAQPNGEYDKYIVLDSETEYLGDLRIMSGYDVCVVGVKGIFFQAIMPFLPLKKGLLTFF